MPVLGLNEKCLLYRQLVSNGERDSPIDNYRSISRTISKNLQKKFFESKIWDFLHFIFTKIILL